MPETTMPELAVLIPTCERKTALAITLTGLLGQSYQGFSVVISDQTTGEGYLADPEIQSVIRALRLHGSEVGLHRHLPRRGMAEQRHFLLSRTQARYVLFLDDDILLEREVVERMLAVLRQERCGFVGCAPIGLSYLEDVRPHEQPIEVWEGPVQPEPLPWEAIPWERHKLHNAANPYHVQQRLTPAGETLRYKVAWIGACVLYDRAKLLAVGDFSWWSELPPDHCGEDVAVQTLLRHRYGGCGILPSGAYHLEAPTQVPDRRANTDAIIRRLLEAWPAEAVSPGSHWSADTGAA